MIVLNAERVKPFYTAIVVKPDMFESTITDERHFGTRDEAEQFQAGQALKGNYCYIMPIEV